MDQATVPPPHDTVRALGCPKSRPPTAQTRVESRMRSRLSGSRRDESRLKSDPRNGNRSSRAWSGDQTKHGTQKYDIEMRCCHFVSYTYSKFTTAVHGHAPRTRTLIARHGQDTTAGRNTNMHAATLPKTDTTSRCSAKFCARGSFWAHTAPNTAHMREQSGRRTCRPRCRREPAREAKG